MLRRLSRGMATVAALSALVMVSQAGAADKLVVKGTDGTTDVFKVADTGVTTIANKTGADTNTVLGINDINGNKVFNFLSTGYLEIGGPITGELRAKSWSSDPNARPVFVGQRHRGTFSAPAPVQLNDKLGTFAFGGYDGSSIVSGALLEVFVDGPVTTNSVPQRMSIVTGSSFSARAERLVVKADGKVGIGTSSPTSKFQVIGLPVYADNAEAVAAGLTAGAFYRTSTGVLMVAY